MLGAILFEWGRVPYIYIYIHICTERGVTCSAIGDPNRAIDARCRLPPRNSLSETTLDLIGTQNAIFVFLAQQLIPIGKRSILPGFICVLARPMQTCISISVEPKVNWFWASFGSCIV